MGFKNWSGDQTKLSSQTLRGYDLACSLVCKVLFHNVLLFKHITLFSSQDLGPHCVFSFLECQRMARVDFFHCSDVDLNVFCLGRPWLIPLSVQMHDVILYL